jgi:hypothetical protein
MNTRMGIFIIALAIVSVALIPSLIPNKPANAQATDCPFESHTPGFVDACKQGKSDHEQCNHYNFAADPQEGYKYGWRLIPDSHCKTPNCDHVSEKGL